MGKAIPMKFSCVGNRHISVHARCYIAVIIDRSYAATVRTLHNWGKMKNLWTVSLMSLNHTPSNSFTQHFLKPDIYPRSRILRIVMEIHKHNRLKVKFQSKASQTDEHFWTKGFPLLSVCSSQWWTACLFSTLWSLWTMTFLYLLYPAFISIYLIKNQPALSDCLTQRE